MVSEEQLQAIHQKLQTLKESGELNGKGADRSENLHRLFMYPAMMVPAAQHAVIKAVADCLPVGARIRRDSDHFWFWHITKDGRSRDS